MRVKMLVGLFRSGGQESSFWESEDVLFEPEERKRCTFLWVFGETLFITYE